MNYGIYSIRDTLNGFGCPICDFNDGSAKRNFKACLSNPEITAVGDYDLFRIGNFDVHTGVITPEVSPVLIMRGIDVRKDDCSG